MRWWERERLNRWRWNVRALRAWWRGDASPLQIGRRPFRISALPNDVMDELRAQPELIPPLLEQLEHDERRRRIRAVP